MINNQIIKIASSTTNVGLKNDYTFKTSKKNSICGDIIKIELIVKNSNIFSMRYETESCIYCNASASLLAKEIKNIPVNKVKKDLGKLKEISSKLKKNKFPFKFKRFKYLINKNNINRLSCVFLPIDAVLKALK